ncbi:kinase-like protein [Mycena pura]|uniref:non-specific serine/threonine protein kinase n=1 Tax=Mycena pura TaxID=153505 RepID=A0AAD6UZ50_9AGAR|nr:kinase-like protein [Mycena pura]
MIRSLSRIAKSFRRYSAETPYLLQIPLKPPAPPVKANYYPVRIGETFKNRYEARQILGYGRYSCVWLAHDADLNREVALKIMVASLISDPSGPDELGILRTLSKFESDASPHSDGGDRICRLLDSFSHPATMDVEHLCLVLEPTSLPLLAFHHAFGAPRPWKLVRQVTRDVLLALRFIHQHGIIHTDIKFDNIMFCGSPVPAGASSIEIDEANIFNGRYKLADFGSANRATHQWASVIQPDALRSPEVALGAPWGTSTDIWNLSCIIFELAQREQLFHPFWKRDGETNHSPIRTHLAQMRTLLGPFPASLITQGHRSEGLFDENGELISRGPFDATLEELILRGRSGPSVEVTFFADFLRRGLALDPAERWSAEQLLEHEWLQGTQT